MLRYRTIVREHIPKRHLDFENPIQCKTFDDTNQRIYGKRTEAEFVATSTAWGTGKNAAHQIPRVGLKSKNFEAQIMQQVQEELQAKAEAEEQARQRRTFQTWNRSEFTEKDITANKIGKKVMRTQDGDNVPMCARDDQLIVETGMWRRTQKATDDELKERVPSGSYDQQTPVTFYTEHLERKNVYMSASTGPQPFGITRGFTQPVQATKAVAGFEGNVDMMRESKCHKMVHNK